MFDDLHLEDWFEGGINELDFKQVNSTVFPNPAKNILMIEFENPELYKFNLTVYNNSGKQILCRENLTDNYVEIDIYDLKPGFYYYKLINNKYKKRTLGKFIKE